VQAFSQANGLYMQARYELAAERARQAVDDFPTDPRAPRALLELGMSRYQLNDFKGAIAAFVELQQKYPDSDQVPDALYFQGLNYEQLKQIPDARRTYNQLIKTHKDSSAAIRAQQRLQAIGGFD
jgi:TolA-binding protein